MKRAAARFQTGFSATTTAEPGRYEWNEKNAASGKRALQIVKTNASGYSIASSDFLPVQAGKTYEVTAQVRATSRSRARVYLMLSQYAPDSDDMSLPNAFSKPDPIYSLGNFAPLRGLITIRQGNTRLRIHLVVDGAEAAVDFDDIELRETTANNAYQPRVEKPVAEALPPLAPAMARLKARRDAVAQTRIVDGRTRLFIDGKMTAPMFYVSPFAAYNEMHAGDFKKAGVRIYLVPLTLGRSVYGDFGPWIGKDNFDWKEVEERLLRVLRVDPDGYVMFYMPTDPYLNWANEHPRAIVKDQNGKKVVVTMHAKDWGRDPIPSQGGYQERWGVSYTSADLRRDTSDALRRLVAYLQTIDAGKAVIGFHTIGGADTQFFQWAGFAEGAPENNPSAYHLADYSDDSRAAFRDWLRRKYRTASTLQAAWHRADVTFENADIPSGERRLAPGFFYDPKADVDVLDYNRFYSEGTAETIAGYARVLKEATGRTKLVSTYWEDTAAPVDSHTATARLLRSPDIDFLAGPTDYGVRMPGQSGEAHSIWGSLALHGKFWVSETDFRSWFSNTVDEDYDLSVGRAQNATDHNNMVRRESGMMLAFGQGIWFYDMYNGWFADAGIMAGISEARRAFERDLSTRGKPRADLAVFVSERSMDFVRQVSSQNQMQAFRFGIVQQIRALNTSGVPYHLYLQSDLPNLKQSYKAYLFLNAYHFEKDEWNALQRLKSGARVLAFLHAPGAMSPATLGAQNAEDAIANVTGIRVKRIAGNDARRMVLALPQAARRVPLAIPHMLASGNIEAPAWEVSDAQATQLGVYSDGKIAAASKTMRDWTSVFVGGTLLTEEFLHALAKSSGAWTAGESGDAIYANQNFFTIHAVWDGEKTLSFLQPSKVTDLTSGKVVATNAKTMKLAMKRGETRWFFLSPVKP